MIDCPKLIVMLTQNDVTAKNAYEIFEDCKDTSAQYFGMKEMPLDITEMRDLFSYMKKCGKKTVLEVVCYDEDGSYKGAEIAVACGCDYLMGTTYSDKINELCKKHGIKYLPFVGKLEERPSVMKGSIDEIIAEAKSYIEKGAFGIDLLGYRYVGDAELLIERLVKEVNAPVCVAGSINTYERLDKMLKVAPQSYTIGSAFFDKCFGETFPEQIENVVKYMNTHSMLEV